MGQRVAKALSGVVVSSAAGALAGFLTRPCCVGPAALSLVGVSSVGLAQAVADYRPQLIAVGALVLAATLVINLRREGGWVNKCLAGSATLIGFGWSMRVLGVW
jgi:hypothetical protein